MKKLHYFFFLCFLSGFAQEVAKTLPFDSLFREDQFYFSVSYNLMREKPNFYSQYSFSAGTSIGFLRDMPISKNRHWAIAVGAGYSYNDIKHNIQVVPDSPMNDYNYQFSFNTNKILLHYVEFPIELRWRNAKYESHKFWRIYTGFKASYLFADKSIYKNGAEVYKVSNNKDLNNWKFGPYLSVGYNTVNLYVSFPLNPIFNNVKIENEPLNLTFFNAGFIFYIL